MTAKLKEYEAIVASGEIGAGTRIEVAALLGRAANEIASLRESVKELADALGGLTFHTDCNRRIKDKQLDEAYKEIEHLRAVLKPIVDVVITAEQDPYECAHRCMTAVAVALRIYREGK